MTEDRPSLLILLIQRFQDHRPVRIVAYHGYGTNERVRLLGRVLRDPGIPPPEADDSAWENLLASYERLESDELAGVVVQGHLAGAVVEVLSDDEGYLTLTFSPNSPLPPGWHPVHLLADQIGATPTQGQVLIPPAHGIGVISDIDDTVIESAVTHPLQLARLTLLANARTRAVFAGVAPFYCALQSGADGQGQNPLFYVSGSPWNLYDLLIDVFQLQGVPAGPLLLRSLEREVVLPALQGQSSLVSHKIASITHILETYPDRQFVLLGDSGQRDPETYQQIVRDFPGRIVAVYIRDVTGDPRDAQIATIAQSFASDGVPFVYAATTVAFAEDAAARGLIAPDAVEVVRAEE
jgi:phosphatidate phosphatase APP1